jgi:hypothetical protein
MNFKDTDRMSEKLLRLFLEHKILTSQGKRINEQ